MGITLRKRTVAGTYVFKSCIFSSTETGTVFAINKLMRKCYTLLFWLTVFLPQVHAQHSLDAVIQQAETIVTRAQKNTDKVTLDKITSLLRPYIQQQKAADLLLKTYTNWCEQKMISNQWSEAEEMADKCLQLSNYNQATPALRNRLIYKRAVMYENAGDNEKALKQYEQSLQYFLKDTATDKYLLAENYNNLALYYDRIGQNDKYIVYQLKAAQLWRKWYKTDVSVNITVLGNLVAAYENYGDAQKALQWTDTLKQYVSLLSKSPYKEHWQKFTKEERWDREDFILLTYVRAYSAAFMAKSVDSCIAVFEKRYAAPRNSYRQENMAFFIGALEQAAWQYKKQKNYQKAFQLYSKAAALAHNDFFRMKGAANLAVFYYDTKQYEKALPYAQKSLQVYQFPEESLSQNGLTALNAELVQLQLKNATADSLLKSVYARQLKKKAGDIVFEKLEASNFNKYINYTQIVILLKSGNVFFTRYGQTKQNADLQQAARFYNMAAELFHQYYLKDSYNFSIDALSKQINEKVLQVQLLLRKNDQALADIYTLLENNYSQHLWKKFLSRNAENLNMPTALLYERNKLVIEQSEFETGNRSKQKEQKKWDSLQQALQKIKYSIDTIHASYNAFAENKSSVESVRKLLSPKQFLLRFIKTENTVYVFGIGKKELVLKEVGDAEELKKLVQQYRRELQTPVGNYRQYSVALYKKLVQPFEKWISAAEKLVIIPDDFLSYLPFETLTDPTENRYLIQKHAISYAYSIKLWELQLSGVAPKAESVVAFAPTYDKAIAATNTQIRSGRNGLFQLNNTKPEAESIVSLYKGKLYADQAATRENFITTLGKYNVYHLAMHAVADGENPDKSSLFFDNNQPLYFNQLYNLNFPATMVVLSACNTGMGVLQDGEGLMSLSRALVYSGVQSAVYSLWEVPDKETAALMILFYQNLSKGYTKEFALAKAKQQFIAENPTKVHPFYWAGFIVNGNTAPISTKQKNWLWVLGITATVGLVLLYLIRKKRKIS